MTGEPESGTIPLGRQVACLILADMWSYLEDSGWSGKLVINVHRNVFFLRVSKDGHTHLIEARLAEDFMVEFLLTFPDYKTRFGTGKNDGDPSTTT